MSNQPPADVVVGPPRDPVAVIADYLDQFAGDEPVAYDRPDAETLVRWLRDEGWEITPVKA